MSTVKDTIDKVRETISHYRMIDPGDRIIVAVSGGADSVILTYLVSSESPALA